MEINLLLISTVLLLVTNNDCVYCQTHGNNCSYIQYVQPGRNYRINNPSFPETYPPGSTCQWYMYADRNYVVRLSCFNVYIPKTYDSCWDYLLVSPIRNIDRQHYCNDFTYEASEITMTLFSHYGIFGGKFSCNVQAVQFANDPSNISDNCVCGWSYATRIVGGTNAQPNEFPSMAALIDLSLKTEICGATIITERAAVTAAHCFGRNSKPQHYGLSAGDHDLTTDTETNATALYKLVTIIRHADSMTTGGGNDIALAITKKIIKFNSQVGPACLPFDIDKEDIMRRYVIASGWGSTFFGGPKSQVLQKVALQVVPDGDCKEYGTNFKPDRHICTFSPGKDACQFDSGGPLYYYYPPINIFVLVGVINSGFGCATNISSLNIDVHHFIPWILKYIPSSKFCRRA